MYKITKSCSYLPVMFLSKISSRSNMPPTKKNSDDKRNMKIQGAQQQMQPIASTSTEAHYAQRTEGDAQLQAQLHIPSRSDIRGPPAPQYQTAHSEPTWDAARDFGPEPYIIHSAATLVPHLLPPSRNGIYPTMVVNDFYESITV